MDKVRVKIPNCEVVGCKNRVLDFGQPAFLVYDRRLKIICGQCACIFSCAYPNIGTTEGSINGTAITASVISLDAENQFVTLA